MTSTLIYSYNISNTMYSTLGQGIGYRKAEEAHKEGGNIAAQVVTKCGVRLSEGSG